MKAPMVVGDRGCVRSQAAADCVGFLGPLHGEVTRIDAYGYAYLELEGAGESRWIAIGDLVLVSAEAEAFAATCTDLATGARSGSPDWRAALVALQEMTAFVKENLLVEDES